MTMTMTGTIKTNNDGDNGNEKHDDVLGGRSHTSEMTIYVFDEHCGHPNKKLTFLAAATETDLGAVGSQTVQSVTNYGRPD